MAVPKLDGAGLAAGRPEWSGRAVSSRPPPTRREGAWCTSCLPQTGEPLCTAGETGPLRRRGPGRCASSFYLGAILSQRPADMSSTGDEPTHDGYNMWHSLQVCWQCADTVAGGSVWRPCWK